MSDERKINYANIVLRQKVLTLKGKFKKHPYHVSKKMWAEQITQLEAGLRLIQQKPVIDERGKDEKSK